MLRRPIETGRLIGARPLAHPEYSDLSANIEKKKRASEKTEALVEWQLAPTICSNILRGLPGQPDRRLVALPEGWQRRLRAWGALELDCSGKSVNSLSAASQICEIATIFAAAFKV